MKIIVNGEEKIITGMCVYDYLHSIECDPMPIAVELNRLILKRSDYQKTFFAEGDQLEIVWFVGGG